MVMHDRKRVLVFNPNTNTSINESLMPILSKLNLTAIEFVYWTCPEGLSIIKTQEDMFESTSRCLPLLLSIAHSFDGFLGACYADHPLIPTLQSFVGHRPVVGIFDASIDAALHYAGSEAQFGIVTTGLAFESLLAEGVIRLLLNYQGRQHDNRLHKFGGVVASNIGMDDLDQRSRETAKEKIMTATRKLLVNRNVKVICVGGVILTGMESWIREACVVSLGRTKGHQIKIIDQISAGGLVINAILQRHDCYDFSKASV